MPAAGDTNAGTVASMPRAVNAMVHLELLRFMFRHPMLEFTPRWPKTTFQVRLLLPKRGGIAVRIGEYLHAPTKYIGL